jgi:hypothetical protein
VRKDRQNVVDLEGIDSIDAFPDKSEKGWEWVYSYKFQISLVRILQD